MDKITDDLFYKNEEQVLDIVKKFSNTILYKKNVNEAFLLIIEFLSIKMS